MSLVLPPRACLGSGMEPKLVELELGGRRFLAGVCRACSFHPPALVQTLGRFVLPTHVSPSPDTREALDKVGDGFLVPIGRPLAPKTTGEVLAAAMCQRAPRVDERR